MEHTKKHLLNEAINAPGPSNATRTSDTEDDVISLDDFSDTENETSSYEFRTLSYSDEITDEELASLNTKDFNRFLKHSSLGPTDIQCLRQRRQTVKNSGDSASLGNKITEEADELRNEKNVVLDKIDALKMRKETLEKEILQLKENYEYLKQYAKSQNICIPQELDDV